MLTEEQYRQARKQGVSVKELAEIEGVSVATIGRRLKRLGLTKPADRTDIKNKEIVILVEQGYSIGQIANKLGCSHDTITKRLQSMGVSFSRQEGIKRHYQRKHKALYPQIAQDLNQGMTKKQVVKKYHLRQDNLNRLLQENSYVKAQISDTYLLQIQREKEKQKGYPSRLRYLDAMEQWFVKKGVLISRKQLADGLSLSYTTVAEMIQKCRWQELVSTHQEGWLVCEFERFLQANGITYQKNVRSLLSNGMEIDFWLEDGQLGVEINPTTSHSTSEQARYSKPKKYHQNKALQARKDGVALVQIYSHIWCDTRKQKILKEMICKACRPFIQKVYARQCVVQPIEPHTYRDFLNQYHLHGAESNSTMRYGLYHGSILVSVMGLAPTRYQKSPCYEIVRYGTRYDIGCVGGFMKLVQAYKKQVSNVRIVSYYDLDYQFSSEPIYDRSGFNCVKVTSPAYVWVDSNEKALSRYQTQKKQLIKKGWLQLGQTEEACMRQHHYKQVFLSGNLLYEYV